MALSTNRTLITQTGINTHQVLNVGGLDSSLVLQHFLISKLDLQTFII